MMLKKSLSVYAFLCLPLFAAAQKSYIDEDFSYGIPMSFIQLDNDGNEPSEDMKAIGFSKGKGWIPYVIDNEGVANGVVCSTSWYSPAGTSDDWLITPAFTVEGADDVLRWKAMAHDKRFSDGYAVYVSTGGEDIADFDKENPLFTIAAENPSWTSRSVSLAAYHGKTVRVAFVNNSTDKSRLYIDDVFAGQASNVYAKVSIPEIMDYAGDMILTGEAYTENTEPVSGFTATFEYGGQVITEKFDLTLEAGKRVPFTFSTPLKVENNTRKGYSLAVTDNATTYRQEGMLTVLAHKNVIEESTGTWCGWCIRGIVALEEIAEKYPGRFEMIAVHNGDPMTVKEYDANINALNPGGFPKMMFNRNPDLKCDPLYASSTCERLLSAAHPYSGLSVTASYDASTNIVSSSTDVFFPVDADTMDYRLAFVLVEDNVHNPDDKRYGQNNAYAGGSSGEMGGYENKDEIVPSTEMYHQDVARGFFGDFNGVEGSVPSTVKAMEPNNFKHSFQLPDSVKDVSSTRLIVMLIDKHNQVANAASATLTGTTGIGKATVAAGNVRVNACNGLVKVNCGGATLLQVRLISPDGRILSAWHGNRADVEIPCTAEGFIVVSVMTDKGTVTRKLAL